MQVGVKPRNDTGILELRLISISTPKILLR